MKTYSITTAAGSFDVAIAKVKKLTAQPGRSVPLADVNLEVGPVTVEIGIWQRPDGTKFALAPSRPWTGTDGKTRYHALAMVPASILNAVAEGYPAEA